MSMTSVGRVAFLATIILTMPAVEAAACTCVTGESACQALSRASAVFVGRVASVSDDPDARPSAYGRVARLTVSEAFTGVGAGDLDVYTGRGGGDCGYGFAAGTEYLVYAYRDDNGRLTTSICSRTQPASWRQDDVKAWRALAATATTAGRLQGQILLNASERSSSAARPDAALLVAVGSGEARRLTLDADGRFTIDVPQGFYRIVLPPDARWTVSSGQTEVFVPGGTTCATVGVYVASVRPPRVPATAG